MALPVFRAPPEQFRDLIGEEGWDFLNQLARHTYGGAITETGTLDGDNIVNIELLKTGETDTAFVLRPTGDTGLQFMASPGVSAEYLLGSANADLPNSRVAQAGTNTVYTEPGAGLFQVDVDPQGVGSLLDADTVDGLEASAFALTGHVHAAVLDEEAWLLAMLTG